jgi:hypothetical protein
LLAAYRRDDWSPRDRAALGRHLSACPACRRAEVSYRGVGESVRQLPSIMPPPGFREAVFAAIRAEEQRAGRAVAAMTEADTSPELPVISSAKRPASLAAAHSRRAAWLNPRVALVAAAAVILLGLLSTQLLPHSGLASLATSLGILHTGNQQAAKPAVVRYMPDSHVRTITRALASTGWLVYSATDAAGVTTIYTENRRTKTITTLAHGAADAPVTLRAVTDGWAFWSVASGSSWTLYAGRPGSDTASATPLLKSGVTVDAPAALTDFWANDGMALVTITTNAGVGEALRFTLPAKGAAGAAPVMVARASAPGHALNNPSTDGSSIIWAESWRDASGQHSSIWSRDAAGQTQQISQDNAAFAPHIANGLLIWVEGQQGTLEARTMANGQQQWVVAQAVDSGSVRVAGEMVLWRSGGELHTWDARTHASSAVEAQIQAAAWAEASASSLVWAGPGGSINVYVLQ